MSWLLTTFKFIDPNTWTRTFLYPTNTYQILAPLSLGKNLCHSWKIFSSRPMH